MTSTKKHNPQNHRQLVVTKIIVDIYIVVSIQKTSVIVDILFSYFNIPEIEIQFDFYCVVLF